MFQYIYKLTVANLGNIFQIEVILFTTDFGVSCTSYF